MPKTNLVAKTSPANRHPGLVPGLNQKIVAESDAVSAHIVKTTLKDLQMAPRKVDEVASLIRNRSVADAAVILAHTPRRAAKPILKLIESARSNAINNHGLAEESLQIESISVTAAPRLKRYRPVARGMAHPFQKRTSHVFVTLSGSIKPSKKSEKSSVISNQSSDKTLTTDNRQLTTEKPTKEVS